MRNGRFSACLFSCGLLLAGGLAHAQGGPDPALQEALSPVSATQAELSPDGAWLAFSWSGSGAPQLWLMDSAGRTQARQLTFGNGIRFFRWAPDGSWLLYGADDSGNGQDAYFRVSMVSTDDFSATPVLPAVSGGSREFGAFNRDGNAFYFASTERNGLDFDIYRHTFASATTERLFEGTDGFFLHAVSPDERYLVLGETVGEDADRLHLFDLRTRSLITLSDPAPRASHAGGGVAWMDDGSGFYLATNANGESAALAFWNMAAGRFQFFDYAERDVGNVLLCGEQQRYLVWIVNEDGFFNVYAQDRLTKQITWLEDLPEDGVLDASCARHGNQLAVRVGSWETAGDIWLWNLQRNTGERVFEAGMAASLPP